MEKYTAQGAEQGLFWSEVEYALSYHRSLTLLTTFSFRYLMIFQIEAFQETFFCDFKYIWILLPRLRCLTSSQFGDKGSWEFVLVPTHVRRPGHSR